jgi:hypothetical protein
MQDLRRSDPAKYDAMQAAGRKAAADFARDYASFDAETVAAVDAFRKDKKLTYAGNPPGLVDERFVSALRAAYLEKKRNGAR